MLGLATFVTSLLGNKCSFFYLLTIFLAFIAIIVTIVFMIAYRLDPHYSEQIEA